MLEKNDCRNQRPALDEGRSAAPAAKAAAKAASGGSSPPTISLWMVKMVGSENPPYLLVKKAPTGIGGVACRQIPPLMVRASTHPTIAAAHNVRLGPTLAVPADLRAFSSVQEP